MLKINVWTLIWLISPRLHLQAEPTLLIWATCRRTENLHCWVFTLGWSTDTYDRSHYCVSGLSKKKRVDCNLNVFFVSIRDMHQCQWSFVIPSSPCFVIFIAMCKGKAQNFCPLLWSMYGDTTNLSEPVPMLVFLENINKISLALQKRCALSIMSKIVSLVLCTTFPVLWNLCVFILLVRDVVSVMKLSRPFQECDSV